MYPLEERTYKFSKNIITICQKIPNSQINNNITNQLVRSVTSVGANYREANGAISRLDFRNKIHICKKEAHESHYWLNLLLDSNEHLRDKIRPLAKEAEELTLIFGEIVSIMKSSKDKFNIQK